MLGSRSNICFSMAFFGKFQDNATDENFKHLSSNSKYLKSTVNYKLYFYHLNENFTCYADADFVNDSNYRKSVSGYCLRLFDNLISWAFKKQSILTLSSTES